MRPIYLIALIIIFTFSAGAQNLPAGFDLSNYGVKVDADKRLMVVMATLEMAGTQNEAGASEKLINTTLTPKGESFRKQLLADTAGLDSDLRRRITMFVAQYKKRHPNATDVELISPFVSMAYTLTPVPELADPVVTLDLPGSLLDVLDFAPLVREFYRRSGISSKLDDYAKLYRAESDGVLRHSSSNMVAQLLNYLHTRPQLFIAEKIKVQTKDAKGKPTLEKIETRVHERHFNIVPEMLAPQGNITFLNARDDYYVILPPDKDVSFTEVRRAYLQFVVDPLVLSNSKEITNLRDWVKPKLDELRKSDPAISPDVLLTTSRSLAAATDVRQAEYIKIRIATDQARQKIDRLSTDAEKQAVSSELDKYKQALADDALIQLAEDYDKGLVLVFFFSDKLREIEESGFDIASSLHEMLVGFDAAKQNERLAGIAESRKRAIAAHNERKGRTEVVMVADNPVTTRLREIQKMIEARDYVKADADLAKLLSDNPAEPRIYYNIGRVASLTAVNIEDPEAQAVKLIAAKDAYSNVIKSATPSTDKALISLTYVSLAKIYEHFNNNEAAIKLYDEAIKLGNVEGGGFQEAIAGKQTLLKPQ